MRINSSIIYIAGLIIAFIFSACDQAENKVVVSPLYFPLNKLITDQIRALDSIDPAVQKKLVVNGSVEISEPEKISWKKELEIFREADINSPVLRGTYDIKEIKSSDQVFVVYSPKEEKKKGVISLKIKYENNTLKSISSEIISSTLLYTFRRNLNLRFKQQGTKSIIQDFSIANSEELLFKDKVETSLAAKIIF